VTIADLIWGETVGLDFTSAKAAILAKQPERPSIAFSYFEGQASYKGKGLMTHIGIGGHALMTLSGLTGENATYTKLADLIWGESDSAPVKAATPKPVKEVEEAVVSTTNFNSVSAKIREKQPLRPGNIINYFGNTGPYKHHGLKVHAGMNLARLLNLAGLTGEDIGTKVDLADLIWGKE